MLKYLIILLDSSAPSFCHYENESRDNILISLDHLKKAVHFAMVENLNVQFVWPNYMLNNDYLRIIDSVDHINIASLEITSQADVLIVDSFREYNTIEPYQNVILRCTLPEFQENIGRTKKYIENAARLSVVFTDIHSWDESYLEMYREILSNLTDYVVEQMIRGNHPQINLLTDRIYLWSMNNCSAGVDSITVGPDGHFYACPAFYYYNHHDSKLGSVDTSLNVLNPQLYRLDHAPICSNCDAWHCRRCIWINKRLTREINTPSKIQCIISHLERDASRQLKETLVSTGMDVSLLSEIPKLSYLDPFENRKQWM